MPLSGLFSASSPRQLAVAYWVCVVAILASYLVACSNLGFRHPPPWPDEGFYLWPALSLQRDWSLLAPQLHPDRPFLGTLPGYMVVQGLIFKLTGFSFQWARTLSSIYVAGGIALLSVLFWRLRFPFASILFCAVFLHSPIALMVGNVGRMEGLVFFVFCAALLLLQRERVYPGLALISLLPLIHANGLYFCLGGVAYWLWAFLRDREACKPSRVDLLVLASALLLWLSYISFLSIHWEFFFDDMQIATAHRTGRGFLVTAQSRLLERAILTPGLVLVGACLTAVFRNRPALILLVCAGPLLLLSATARGWPYEFYLAVMYLLTSVLLVTAIVGNASIRGSSSGSFWKRLAGTALVLLVAGLGGFAFYHEEPLIRSIQAATTEGAASSPVPYFDDSDRQTVRAFIQRQAAHGPVTIMFFPQADALLFADLESEMVRFLQPMAHHAIADIVILHGSRHLPDWVERANANRARHGQGVQTPVRAWRLLHERDTTEWWRVAATKPSW